MKKLYLFVVLLLWVAAACQRDDIMTYHAVDYIQFERNLADSSLCTFLPCPDVEQLRFPVVVEVVGLTSAQDREYKVEVIDEFTTVSAGNYDLPERFVMKARTVKDTVWIVFKNSRELKEKPRRLTIRLAETDGFTLGQIEHRGNIINVSDVVTKPDWWNAIIDYYFLGTYSDKKYRLFIQETGILDMNPNDLNECRYYTLIFKNYLKKKKDANTPVLEDDNSEMNVALSAG